MKKRFNEEQIVGILREGQGGEHGEGALRSAQHQRADVLCMEAQVRRDGCP